MKLIFQMNPTGQLIFFITSMLGIILLVTLVILLVKFHINRNAGHNRNLMLIIAGMFMLMLGFSIQAFRYDFRFADALTMTCFLISAFLNFRFAYLGRFAPHFRSAK